MRRLATLARALGCAIVAVSCHEHVEATTDAGDSAPAYVATPCTRPPPPAGALTLTELRELVRSCTGQTPDAATEPLRVAFGTGSELVSVDTLAADGSARRLIAVVESPPTLRAWTDAPAAPPALGAPLPAMRARYDSLGGEAVIVEGLTTTGFNVTGTNGLIIVQWDRLWLLRGQRLVEAGRWALNGEEEGKKPNGPVRSFTAKALLHGDRVEVREDVVWSWYSYSYTNAEGERRDLQASVATTFVRGFTLRDDKLVPDEVHETVPPWPKKASR